MERYEQIFDKIATSQMEDWDLQKFKKSHPTLFEVILKSMKEIENQEIFNMSIEDWENPENYSYPYLNEDYYEHEGL